MRRLLLLLSTTLLLLGSLQPPAWAVTPPKRMWWNSTRETRRQALRSSNHVAWQQVVADSDFAADSNGASKEDVRTAATIRYQLTGDTAYADIAESLWDNHIKVPPANPDSSPNFTREHFMEYSWGYDWLSNGGLTDTERTNWINAMNYWVDSVLGTVSGGFGTSKSDVDELIGHYFGVITWALVSAPDNATKSNTILTNSTIGGLTPTGADKANWRNAIKLYVTESSNGSGFESTQYDLGTLQLLMMGADAVNTIKNDGVDYFPEVTALADEYAKWAISLVTPNRADTFKYGSVEGGNARSNFDERLKPFANILMEFLSGNAFRPYLNNFQAQFSNSGECSLTPESSHCYNWRGFLFGDPVSTSEDYKLGMEKGTADTTHGYYAYHDDWTNTSGSAFYVACPNTTRIVGHTEGYGCTWDLYRNGQWAVTHIVGYDGTTSSNVPGDKTRFFNTMLIGGLPVMKQVRHTWGVQSADDFAYMVASTGAMRYSDEMSNAPNRYLHEWTRSHVYLPSTDASMDWVGIVDRVNADDPTTVTNSANYYNSAGTNGCPGAGLCDKTAVNAGNLRKIWAFHNRASPTGTGNTRTWTVTAADPDYTVKLEMFLPPEANRTVSSSNIGSSVPSSTEGYIDPNDPSKNIAQGPGQWRTLVSETPNTKWSLFANTVSAYPSSAPTSTLITVADSTAGDTCESSTDYEAIGWRVARTGHNDYDVLFNAKQACDIPPTDTVGTIQWGTSCTGTTSSSCTAGIDFEAIVNQNRLRTTGYTYTSPAGSTSTRKVLIADLDPDLSWSYKVDSGSTTGCTVTEAAPLCTFTVSGSGSHTILISQTGAPPASDTTDPTVSITSPSTGATVSGTVAVDADAADAVGVVGVQFKLDGANLGAEDTSSPYSVGWITTTATNGSHSLTAVARDAAGNDATSAAISVTVNNTVPSTGLLTVLSPSSYVVGTLAVGQLLYTDRVYTISSLPTNLVSLEYVRTANNDRTNSDANYLSLSLSADATLFVIFNHVDPLPGWLDDGTWTARTETVDTSDNDGDLREVYSKAYAAGSVVLGGKNYPPGSGGDSNYIVAAAPIFLELTAPADDATVSGASVTLTADPGTTSGVSGVQFTVDGNNQGSEDVSSPFTITWDSTAVGNGTHTIGAVLRKSDGFLYPAQTISVTVNNVQADVTAPTISSVSSGTPGTTSATITWNTNEGASGYVEYGLTTDYGSQTTLVPALNTAHSHSLTDLQAGVEGAGVGTTYSFKIHATDQAGNEATSTGTFDTAAVPDTTLPILSSIVAGANTTTAATVTWTSDESSDSQAEVRTSAGAVIGTATHTDATDVTSHSLPIDSLTAATTYHYAVRSQDAAGNNSAWSSTATFATPADADVTAPTITNVVATPVDFETATITYDSSEVCDTEVRYGLDTDYGTTASDASDVLAHSLTLTALSPVTTYHYQVRCTDPANNVSAYSTDDTFQTPDQVSEQPEDEVLQAVGAWLISISGGSLGPQ